MTRGWSRLRLRTPSFALCRNASPGGYPGYSAASAVCIAAYTSTVIASVRAVNAMVNASAAAADGNATVTVTAIIIVIVTLTTTVTAHG